eukprot:363560-Chlamydomonas_euryale.AAC.16
MKYQCVSRHGLDAGWVVLTNGRGLNAPRSIRGHSNSDDPIQRPKPPDPQTEAQWNRPLGLPADPRTPPSYVKNLNVVKMFFLILKLEIVMTQSSATLHTASAPGPGHRCNLYARLLAYSHKEETVRA